MSKRKVLVVKEDNFEQVAAMFLSEGWGITDDIDEADLIQFTGGADVNPKLYGHHKHSSTWFDEARDQREAVFYTAAIDRGIPLAGICRGGQFLNVMNGGTMFQDVDNHAIGGTHDAWLPGANLPVKVTSTHHQMMQPNYDDQHRVLLTAGEATRKIGMSSMSYQNYEVATTPAKGGKPTDIECIFYPNTRTLCFQPHPEYNGRHVAETKEVYFELIERYLFDEMEERLQA